MKYLGLSGGMDSVAQFHKLLEQNFKFVCIHINHNQNQYDIISQAFCENLCRKYSVKLIISNVYATNETNARDLRYAEFLKFVTPNDVLLLGHHLDDSVETTILNIFNGTSVFGARGIGDISVYKNMNISRPFITNGIKKEDLKSYLKSRNQDWIEDMTNYDTNIKRNFIRHVLLPSLSKIFPNAVNKIAEFGISCKKQSLLNDKLAQYTHSLVSNPCNTSLLIADKVITLDEMELENWFFWFARTNKLFLTARHFTEFNKFIKSSNYKSVEINNIKFLKRDQWLEYSFK